MRIAALLIIAAMSSPAHAEPERILEPAKKLTLEQQAGKTLGAAYTKKQCPFVRKRNSLMDMFPAYLIDQDGTKKVAEYKFVVYYGRILRVSKLLPPDHPSKCKMMAFVADIETGKLDVGAYENCDGNEDIRRSDGFYYDPEKKQRMGLEHKLRWDIAFRRLMWKTDEIAAKCTI